MDPVELFAKWRVVPVVVIGSPSSVEPLAEALALGGLPCAEVTLRTPAALAALRVFAERDDITVGAGSVRTAEEVEQAVTAGARFIVSPGFSDRVLARCRELDVAHLPGVATATEIMRALDAGLNVAKFFPAGQLGGPVGLRSIAAPFPTIRFVPTGGITERDLADYLAMPAVLAVGGSWMVAPELLEAARFDEIQRRTARAVETVRQARP